MKILKIILLIAFIIKLDALNFRLEIGNNLEQIMDPKDSQAPFFPPPMSILKDELLLLDLNYQKLKFYNNENSLTKTIDLNIEGLKNYGPFHYFAEINEQNYFLASFTENSLIHYNNSLGTIKALAYKDSSKDYFSSIGDIFFRDNFLYANDLKNGNILVFSKSGNYISNLSGSGLQFLPIGIDEVLTIGERGGLSVIEKSRIGGLKTAFYEYKKGELHAANSLKFVGLDQFKNIYIEKIYAAELGERKADIFKFSFAGKLIAQKTFNITDKEFFEFENYFQIYSDGILKISFLEGDKNYLSIDTISF